MADLGQYYVQVIPSTRGISGSLTKALSGEASTAGASAGKSIGSSIKGALAKAGIGLAIGGTLKKALDEGGKLQQSYGGLETIYGDAADAAKKYAKEAANAGISANDYAEQAVSFGASLRQAFKGDTTKAVEAANTAILDMTDNAAKMGTPIQDIQHAYQGFAKQNYTMLDNLKLGYGGTKQEMERLLADAEQLTGKKYDISNLGDVYDAIHAIQGELGLTGVAAAEASTTFTGSFEAMKASLSNLLGAMALGEDVKAPMQQLITSAGTFLFNNFIPMVGNVLKSLPSAMAGALQTIIPTLVGNGGAIVDSILQGINQGIPLVTQALPQMITNGMSVITENLPTVLAKGREIIANLANGILENLPAIIDAIRGVVERFVQFISDNLPLVIDEGIKLVGSLAKGLGKNMPAILGALVKLGGTILLGLLKLAPKLITGGGKLVFAIAKGLGGSALHAIRDAMERLKERITKPFQDAIDKVKGIVDKVKGFFPIKVGNLLSGLKLPHISISGSFSLKPPSVPHVSVSWYKKAGDNPYMFGDATLFGAGEAGDEILYGRRALMSDISKAVGNGRNITNNITMNVDGSENPEEFATRFVRQLQMDMRMI